ncbi:MAG: four helix bundle protein [Limisphaerales bacterium]
MAAKLINHHWELDVYRLSVETSMEIFRASKSWPHEERYSLTDQVRRSSRSVSAAIAEAWRRRKYSPAFVNKLNEAESEAAETQTWIEYAVKCEYLSRKEGARLFQAADRVIGKLVKMGNEPEKWVLSKSHPNR